MKSPQTGNLTSTFMSAITLKQHYVTLTATHCFEKQNLTMHVDTLHKTAILIKSSQILQKKMSSGFPDVRQLLCLSAAFYFSGAVTSNNLVLQLQLWSAGSLRIAFRNLPESQSGKAEEVAITAGRLGCFLSTYFVNGAGVFSLALLFWGLG